MDHVCINGAKIELKKLYDSENDAYKALLTQELASVYSGCEEFKELDDRVIESYAVTEVESVKDIGKRQGDPESTSRAYMLVLSDGHTEVQAFEYNPWDFSLTNGCRVLLIPPFRIKRNVLLLNPSNILLLTM
jgi:RecQ mediated genome instability protein